MLVYEDGSDALDGQQGVLSARTGVFCDEDSEYLENGMCQYADKL